MDALEGMDVGVMWSNLAHLLSQSLVVQNFVSFKVIVKTSTL